MTAEDRETDAKLRPPDELCRPHPAADSASAIQQGTTIRVTGTAGSNPLAPTISNRCRRVSLLHQAGPLGRGDALAEPGSGGSTLPPAARRAAVVAGATRPIRRLIQTYTTSDGSRHACITAIAAPTPARSVRAPAIGARPAERSEMARARTDAMVALAVAGYRSMRRALRAVSAGG